MNVKSDISLIYEVYKGASLYVEHSDDEVSSDTGRYNTINVYSRSLENPMQLVYQAEVISSQQDNDTETYIGETFDGKKTIQVIIVDKTKETSVVIKDENGLVEDQFVERNITFSDPDHADELNILKIVQ